MLHQDFGVLRLKGDLGCAPRARQKGLQNEAFLARARARRATQDPFTPRAPFKGNLANQTWFFETVAEKIWVKSNKRGRAEPSCLAESASQPAMYSRSVSQSASQPAVSKINAASRASQPAS